MITELYAKTIFSFIRDCQTVFQFCVSNTTMRHGVSVAPRHCQQMILPVFLDFSLSQRCVVLSHYYSTWICQRQTCWASFHILLGHLCIFFGKMSTQIFVCSYFNWAVFLLLNKDIFYKRIFVFCTDLHNLLEKRL